MDALITCPSAPRQQTCFRRRIRPYVRSRTRNVGKTCIREDIRDNKRGEDGMRRKDDTIKIHDTRRNRQVDRANTS